MSKKSFEIVKWKSKKGVTDEDMISAVSFLAEDLKSCKGFLQQTLYKNSDDEWVDIYYWKDDICAHASNEFMTDKASFSVLTSLIEPSSISFEVLPVLQSSGAVTLE